MKTLRFSKMHGLGNDFIVIDGIHQSFRPHPDQIRQWADRHCGIGFDQLLLVETAPDAQADFRYRIFNADGGEVENCGNGARCFARYVHDRGLTSKTTIRALTAKGLLTLTLHGELVEVDMGVPQTQPMQIPFLATQEQVIYPLECLGQTWQVSVVSMGNPHAVLLVQDVSTAPVSELGGALEVHPSFPQRANIGFMQVINDHQIRLRVFERGAGETQACGTGACAAMVAGRLRGLLAAQVQVSMHGGDLQIHWQQAGEALQMMGPAAFVFDGEIAYANSD